MGPVVHGLEAEYVGDIGFVYLDIDDPDTAAFKQSLGYEVQPHFFLVDGDGAIVESWRGSVGEDEFRAAFDALLAGSAS